MPACPGHSNVDLTTLSRQVDRIGYTTDWEGSAMQPLCDAAGIDLVSQGGARTVIGLCAEHVAKFEPTLSGLYGNHIELAIWEQSPPELREHLVPIFGSGTDKASGTNWLVMGRATPIDVDVDDDLESFVAAIQGIGDLEYCNLGVYKGRVVLVDYGERTSEPLGFDPTAPFAPTSPGL